ncbi:MAG: hypothetical protein AABZ74_14065 [Cyanobacteriota bacterium]
MFFIENSYGYKDNIAFHYHIGFGYDIHITNYIKVGLSFSYNNVLNIGNTNRLTFYKENPFLVKLSFITKLNFKYSLQKILNLLF